MLLEAEAASHDFVIGELACGRLKNRNEILLLLQALPRISVVTQDEILYFIEEHSLSAARIGLFDIHDKTHPTAILFESRIVEPLL